MRALMKLKKIQNTKKQYDIVPSFSNVRLVCALHHMRHEKNVQGFIDKSGKTSYQYSINPWVFFDSSCNKITHKNTLFSKVVHFYDSRKDVSFFQKNIQFSCSTPLIELDANTFIGSGHFKCKYEHAFRSNTPISVFLNNSAKLFNQKKLKHEGKEQFIHPEYVYGMFIYTVNKTTYNLDKVSSCFVLIDKSYKQLLTFPSGITKHNDNSYLISYHENDITIKLLELTVSDIAKMLKYNNNTSPSAFKFEFIKL